MSGREEARGVGDGRSLHLPRKEHVEKVWRGMMALHCSAFTDHCLPAAQYHAWMSSDEIQEQTASEPLSIAEEYAMQQSWQQDEDSAWMQGQETHKEAC